MEMRNTEQLLGSVGLLAHQADALDELNAALKNYGPETSYGDRITVKKNQQQQTAVVKSNIHVCSMSGPTERDILDNLEDIVEHALPIKKLQTAYYDTRSLISKNLVLNRITFYSQRIKFYEDQMESNKYIRDFGTHTEVIVLSGSEAKKDMEKRKDLWKQKLNCLSDEFRSACRIKRETADKLALVAAKEQQTLLKMVCREWKEIATITRERIYEESEQSKIDLFDIKCKEWGYNLKELFGSSLGMGDYGHLLIDHAPMLMRRFLSMTKYSQQGFEASHKDQRQLWLKSSNHDCKGEASSIEQILKHFYSEKTLFLRYCLREAIRVVQGHHGKKNNYDFYFRGCGWKKKEICWTEEDILWIKIIDQLMTSTFGNDFLKYEYDDDKTCIICPDSMPEAIYNRLEWNEDYSTITAGDDPQSDTTRTEEELPSLPRQQKDDIIQNQHQEQLASKTDITKTQPHLQQYDDDDVVVDDDDDDQDRVIAIFPSPTAPGGVTLLQMDLDTLKDGVELNDAIVDFFIKYTCERLKDSHSVGKCHFFSSFFFTKLSEKLKKGEKFVLPSPEARHTKASSFTRRVNIFEKELIFIPVCRSHHWFLLVVHYIQKDSDMSIFVIDSLAGSKSHEVKLLRSFLKYEWKAKMGTEDFNFDKLPVLSPKVPQQENNYDCGIFLLLFVQEFLERQNPVKALNSSNPIQWYGQSDALPLRRRICQTILNL